MHSCRFSMMRRQRRSASRTAATLPKASEAGTAAKGSRGHATFRAPSVFARTTPGTGRPIMLKNIRRTILLASAAIAAIGTGAIAADVGRVATIDIPGNKFDNFDIGYVDSNASRYYIADRSNAAVDIFATQKT